jgi:hypothetical protein
MKLVIEKEKRIIKKVKRKIGAGITSSKKSISK